MEKYAIVLTSCDSFSDLWENSIFLFEKYWANHPTINMVSDKKNSMCEKLNINFYYYSNDYSIRLLRTLETLDCDYVFLTLDDYLICDYVNEKRICELIDIMTAKNISYIRLFKKAKTRGWINKTEKIHLLPLRKEAYEVNLYPSIWKRIDLIKIIKNEENIWKFEVRLTRRCRENSYLCGWVNNDCFKFVDTIRKGKYIRNAYRFLKREKLFISNRQIRTIKETLFLSFRTLVSDCAPSFLKRFLKKIVKGNYFSDYVDGDD